VARYLRRYDDFVEVCPVSGRGPRNVDYDKTDIARAYDHGRGYTTAQLNRWLAVISGCIPNGSLSAILDLGCGTGRYSGALAEHFHARVVAVDPSEKMLAEARTKAAGEVAYMRACAESLPLSQGSVDMVFVSMVFHHFDDPVRAAHECHRVLRPGAAVCLRAATTEQIDRYAYVPFFPESRDILRRSLNPRRFIESTFASAGFQRCEYELVWSEAGANWSYYAERIARRADSILVRLPDSEFQRGLQALRAHAAAATKHNAVVEPIDFFVFQSV
jgi:ubiquinone/menaquinone biosynthesis C-methylase UbiE